VRVKLKLKRNSSIIVILLFSFVLLVPVNSKVETNDLVDNVFLPQAMGVYEEWSFTTGDWVRSSPAVADLDGDGTLEVLVGSKDDKLYCLSHLGTEEWSYTTGCIV